MKYGTAYKNLTDAFLVIGAAIAIICIVMAVLAFEGPGTTVENKATGEKITVNSVFEDPTVQTYAKLGGVFTLAAALSFAFRKLYTIPLVATAAAIVFSMDVFLDGSIEEVAYAFVLFAVIGLVGNVIHGVIVEREQKEAKKNKVEDKKAKPAKAK